MASFVRLDSLSKVAGSTPQTSKKGAKIPSWFNSLWPFNRTSSKASKSRNFTAIVVHDQNGEESKVDEAGRNVLGKPRAQQKLKYGMGPYKLAVQRNRDPLGSDPTPTYTKIVIEALQEGVEQGHPLAFFQLASVLEKNNQLKEAADYYKKFLIIATQDYEPSFDVCAAYSHLASIYMRGGKGLPKDEALAIQYYEAAVKRNCPAYVKYEFALLLTKEGTKFQNLERAASLLHETADIYADAKCELGKFYRKGLYVKKNVEHAEKLWLDLYGNHKESSFQLGCLYEKGYQDDEVTIPQDLTKATKNYRQALLFHHPDAQEALDRIAKAEYAESVKVKEVWI